MNGGWLRRELTYCTNVHPGDSLARVMDIVDGPLAGVRQRRGLTQMTGGLWFSPNTVRELLADDNLRQFAERIEDQGIDLFTLNGFPALDFHSARVKEAVYRPDWADEQRLQYTLDLARILAALMGSGNDSGTISTVPLGFAPEWHGERHRKALAALCRAAQELDEIYRRSGKKIRLCLEMEPGCALEDTENLVAFFTRDLAECAASGNLDQALIDEHLGICFDICHQAVMFEDIYAALRRIDAAGIGIGKIQVSSALQLDHPDDAAGRSALAEFAEPRYLHQACCRDEQGRLHRSMDLEQALSSLPRGDCWRVHFHAPIQAESLVSEKLATTQREIGRALDFLHDHPRLHPHLEVETYTWNVLPESIRPVDDASIVDGLTAELDWLEAQMRQRGLLDD